MKKHSAAILALMFTMLFVLTACDTKQPAKPPAPNEHFMSSQQRALEKAKKLEKSLEEVEEARRKKWEEMGI